MYLAPVATGLAKFATDFLQKLGILKPEENTEDMGDRALLRSHPFLGTDLRRSAFEYPRSRWVSQRSCVGPATPAHCSEIPLPVMMELWILKKDYSRKERKLSKKI